MDMKKSYSDISDDEAICEAGCDDELPIKKNVEELRSHHEKMWNQLLKKYSFDESLKETEDCPETQLKLLIDFVENQLESHLKYYYIKLLSSRIRGDGKYDHWSKLVDKELKKLKERVSSKHILMYIDNIIPAFDHKFLINKIENEYKSDIKSLFQLRNDNTISGEEYRKLVEREWKFLEINIPEEFICAYYAIYFGNPLSN